MKVHASLLPFPSLGLLAAPALANSQTFNISFYTDGQWKSFLSSREISLTSGCQTAPSTQTFSVEFHSSSPPRDIDDGGAVQHVRLYKSPDCSSYCSAPTILHASGGGSQSFEPFRPASRWARLKAALGVEKSALGSYDVVELDRYGRVPSDGYCGLVHGDEVKLRGARFRWWQVAMHSFVEVPIGEWDESVHVRDESEGVKAPQHGFVDEDGKYKYQQVAKGAWSGVSVEEWDDAVHVRNENEIPGMVYDDAGNMIAAEEAKTEL